MGVHSVATCLSKFFIEVYQVFGNAANRNMWQINVIYIYEWILNMNNEWRLMQKTLQIITKNTQLPVICYWNAEGVLLPVICYWNAEGVLFNGSHLLFIYIYIYIYIYIFIYICIHVLLGYSL